MIDKDLVEASLVLDIDNLMRDIRGTDYLPVPMARFEDGAFALLWPDGAVDGVVDGVNVLAGQLQSTKMTVYRNGERHCIVQLHDVGVRTIGRDVVLCAAFFAKNK